jgi:hypothetical protein
VEDPSFQLGLAPSRKGRHLPDDDPLLNLDAFAVEGPGGTMSNADIDRILYGGA